MSTPGMGAMIHALSGGSPKSPSDYYGRTITKAEQTDNELRLTFGDGVTIRLWDDGQSCCESRCMRTDDSLKTLAGQKLVAIETNVAKSAAGSSEDPERCSVEEAAFLDIKTEAGVAATFSFHNSHNGYYGGFGLSLDEV